MRPNPFLVLAFCSLILLAVPGFAKEANVEAEGQIAAIFAPANCAAAVIGVPEPLFRVGCSVQVECADSSVISCSGNNTCSTGGTNNRCVVCDNVQQSCCPATCCEVCASNYTDCDNNCSDEWYLPCGRACLRVYNNCVAGCTGGCP